MEGTRTAIGGRCARTALAAVLAVALMPAIEAEAVSASTDVYVRTLPATLRITAVTKDISGSAEEVRSMSLSVEAEAEGDVSFIWERSAGGIADAAFLHKGATCALSDVEPDTDYVYTVTASDGLGLIDSASVHVSVGSETSEYFTERVTYPAYSATVEARIRTGSHIELEVHAVGTDVFARLLSHAKGARLFPPAYTVRIVDAPEGLPSHEGDISVSFIVPSGPSFIDQAWADDGEAVPRSVFMLDDDEGSRTLAASESAGMVSVSLPTLGSFALVDESSRVPIVPGGESPDDPIVPGGESPSDPIVPGGESSGVPIALPTANRAQDGSTPFGILGSTGDRALAAAVSLVAIGALVLAFAAARRMSKRRAHARQGRHEAGR